MGKVKQECRSRAVASAPRQTGSTPAQYARTVSPHSKPVQHASAMSWRANAAITRAFGEKRKTGSGLLPVCIGRVCFAGMQG